MKHTPGPWKWFNGCSWWRLGTFDGARDGGSVICPSIDSDGHPNLIISEADKALVAAAPDLLKALKSAGSLIASLDCLHHYPMVRQLISAAIDKAEGRP